MKDNVTGKDKEFVQKPLEYWTVAEGWVKIDEVPVYTAPPQRPWVGLTDDEIYRIAFELEGEHWTKIARAIENALRSKNT